MVCRIRIPSTGRGQHGDDEQDRCFPDNGLPSRRSQTYTSDHGREYLVRVPTQPVRNRSEPASAAGPLRPPGTWGSGPARPGPRAKCDMPSFVAWHYPGGDLVLSQVSLYGEQTKHQCWSTQLETAAADIPIRSGGNIRTGTPDPIRPACGVSRFRSRPARIHHREPRSGTPRCGAERVGRCSYRARRGRTLR